MNNKEFAIGKLKEEDFSKLFNNVTPSSTKEDMFEHWDINIGIKIDVKGLKKQSRYDMFYDENFHWVELQNVNGDASWLYGEADYFAFETLAYWIIVDKIKLQWFIEGNTEGKEVGKSKDPYELYQRDGRKDIVVKVKTLDLVYLSTKMIKKK